MKSVELGDVALSLQDGPFGSNLKSSHYVDHGVRVVRLQNIGVGQFDDRDRAFVTEEHFTRLRKHECRPGDVLIATLGDPIVRACLQPSWLEVALHKADCLRLRCDPDRIIPEYLVQFLNSDALLSQAKRLAHGQTRPRINLSQLRSVRVPLPPLPEQQRIAHILHIADSLRAKRHAALAQLESLSHSIFLSMFGDPRVNRFSWPEHSFREWLSMPLRNGVSPSYGGSVRANVLTLSAITGGAFDPAAQKEGTFRYSPTLDQRVDHQDLLICRGNGNRGLVGRGYFANESMPDVVFPDTMIAARIAPHVAEAAFVQHLWNSDSIRTQLKALARTTNGTFKINQRMLEGVTVVTPPLPLQRQFAERRAAITGVKVRHLRFGAGLDALFASLQHRAFRGEL